ncbi:MAG: hypothetical protein AAF333_06900 [Planctomycetota bacterium]
MPQADKGGGDGPAAGLDSCNVEFRGGAGQRKCGAVWLAGGVVGVVRVGVVSGVPKAGGVGFGSGLG